MIALREQLYGVDISHNSELLMGADIGGTNSNFGFFQKTDNGLQLVVSIHAKSQEVHDFAQLVKDVLALLKTNYGVTVKKGVIAAAGVISEHRDYCKPTNLNLEINTQLIMQATGMTCVMLANDFEVIGYGLNLIDPKSLVRVNGGEPRNHANKAIIGAGTGLGKCIMRWSNYAGRYIPIVSEGGHADFAIQHHIELELASFIKKSEHFDCNISWEDVLSGNGIQRIYQFFHSRTHSAHADGEQMPHPDEIFKDRVKNQHNKDTFELYSRFYARCAKNFALDALALGGVYIAGGIAAHNLEMFQLPGFMQEFLNCGKQQYLLKQVPIYVITDYNISLYGAVHYLVLEQMCD